MPSPIAALAPGGAKAPHALAQDVRALLLDVASHWRSALKQSPAAIDYLMHRGIRGATAGRFGVGYARPRPRDLVRVLRRHSQAAIDASGLLLNLQAGERSTSIDRFRDRIMFPIFAADDTIAGFGGRLLSDTHKADAPKYLGSPAGPTYSKSDLLFGVPQARAAIKAAGRVVAVEGYVDVMSMSQAGLPAAVAVMGTSFPAPQLEQLLSLSDRVIFCFDGDAAGRAAACSALLACAPFVDDGREFRFALLPGSHDPDSYVREHGAAALAAQLDAARSFADFLVDTVTDRETLADAESRARAFARARPFWHAMPDGHERLNLLEYFSGLLALPAGDLIALWGGLG